MAEVPGPGQEGAQLSPQMSASIRGRSEPEPATHSLPSTFTLNETQNPREEVAEGKLAEFIMNRQGQCPAAGRSVF